MARYIDAELLLQEIEEETPLNWTDSDRELQEQLDYQIFKHIVDYQPTADVVEVRRGEWIDNHNGTFTCTVCGGKCSKMDWCGRCGADMRGIKNDKDQRTD